MGLQFQKAALKEVEEQYRRVQLAPEQRQIIVALATIACQHIPIREIAMRGFILLAMKDYQLEHKMAISSLMSAPPAARAKVMEDVAHRVRNRLERVLVKKEQTPQLEQALHTVIETYRSSFAQR